jgi:hypothetical protein
MLGEAEAPAEPPTTGLAPGDEKGESAPSCPRRPRRDASCKEAREGRRLRSWGTALPYKGGGPTITGLARPGGLVTVFGDTALPTTNKGEPPTTGLTPSCPRPRRDASCKEAREGRRLRS